MFKKKLKATYIILLLYLSLYLTEPFLFLIFSPFIIFSKIYLSSENKKNHITYLFLFVSALF